MLVQSTWAKPIWMNLEWDQLGIIDLLSKFSEIFKFIWFTYSSSYFGTVRNPWNLLKTDIDLSPDSNEFYISGGSSGGSAATVAAGIASL